MGEAQRRMAAGNYPLGQPRPGQQVQVDLKNATQKECECGCKYFNQEIAVFIVSALTSPTGQELTVQQSRLVCSECKKQLNPKSPEKNE